LRVYGGYGKGIRRIEVASEEHTARMCHRDNDRILGSLVSSREVVRQVGNKSVLIGDLDIVSRDTKYKSRGNTQ
jgi:hypothetical protein